jgi:hypothetical protein
MQAYRKNIFENSNMAVQRVALVPVVPGSVLGLELAF